MLFFDWLPKFECNSILLTSTFVRNTDFVLGAEMEYESIWAYSSWALSAFDFIISTYVVLFTWFTCLVASIFTVLPLVSSPLVSSFYKLPVEGISKDRMGQQCQCKNLLQHHHPKIKGRSKEKAIKVEKFFYREIRKYKAKERFFFD